TFPDAIRDLLGVEEPDEPEPEPDPDPEQPGGGQGPGAEEPATGSAAEQVRRLLDRADAAYDRAAAALENGDLAEYQAQNEQAAELVGEALELSAQLDTGGGDSQD